MEIKLISSPITRQEALRIGKVWYPEIVKGVVDIERKIIALGGEFHIDANMVLIENGSLQPSLWGFNIYPERTGQDWIEYTSLINIRPKAKNLTMTVKDEALQKIMKDIIESLII